MRSWLAALMLVILLAGVSFYFYSPRPTAPVLPPATTPAALPAVSVAEPKAAAAPAAEPSPAGPRVALPGALGYPLVTNESKPQALPAAPVEPLPPELASIEPVTVLENMRTIIRQYGQMFGGNPVGTNPEITSALGGNNPRKINFLKADGNRVNANGELVDPWGTPYFFHQLSGTQMEIRSAGPDRVMYTVDDLVSR
jgi:hypothetical protein